MPTYAIFGGVLSSDIEFPDLRPARSETPTWTFRTALDRAPLAEPELLGEDVVDGDIRVRLWKSARGYRLDYDDTGTFDISPDGTEIVWCPRPQTQVDQARLDVIGRVLGTAMHVSGLLCLHGSAVAFDDRVVAFIAPKHHGKSTLAAALTRRGARLVTDDTLPVDPRPPVTVWPGVHSVRLFGDSAEWLRVVESRGDNPFYEKHTLSDLQEERLLVEPAPLAAIYVLTPVLSPSPAQPAARRTRLTGVAAAMALIGHTKLGPLLGKSEADVVLGRTMDLAARVPVYTLEIVRDLDALHAVMAQLAEWHARSVAASQPIARVGT
jgi:hypothetical protein